MNAFVFFNLYSKVRPPIAKVIPKVIELHGDRRIDNYFWLRERDDPEVIQYLNAENDYTNFVMKDTKALQEKLFKEMVGRIKETDMSVPVQIDDYFYYSRTEKGKQYQIHCRKKGSMDAKEEILLDENELAKGHTFLHVGVLEVSPDHRYLAYSTDYNGSEVYTLRIKDLETGKLLEEQITNTFGSLEWANDNKTIFYDVLDEIKRPYRIYKHVIGADPKEDVLLYQEDDEAFYVGVSKTRSKSFIIISSESTTTTEVYFMDANDPSQPLKLISPRQQGVEYYVEDHDDYFYILTNDSDAKNFKLMKAPISSPSKDNWIDFIPHRDSVRLEDFDTFKDYIVLYERECGIRKIRIINTLSGEDYYIDFSEPIYNFWPGDNPNFNTDVLRIEYNSLVTPRTTIDFNMKDKTREVKKEQEIPSGYDKGQYISERIFAKSYDGTLVPISLVYKKGIVKDGRNPLYLCGYGAYGASLEANFSTTRLSLLDRGFIYAMAHVRGGEEMGRTWYEQGKLLNKKNTFYDFIACAEHLISEGYTSSDRLVISGASAGGLLVGAVTNMCPELFKVVIADVPFVDVLNTMLDPSIPLTVTEYEEWGNPNQKEFYEYIKSYSPYDNVAPKDYPNILIIANLNDSRVQYWEPVKWAAKLRALKTDNNILLLKVDMGVGHSGSSGRYDHLREIAFEYAFILKCLGMTNDGGNN